MGITFRTKLFWIVLLTRLLCHAQFLPGHLVVLQVGDGVTSFTNTGNPLFLKSFSPQGAASFSVALPVTGNTALVLAGSSSTEGFINTSPDRSILVVGGYNKSLPNTVNLPGATASNVNRAIASVDVSGNYTLSSTSASFFSTGNIRGAAVNNSGDYWASGSTQGTPYFGNTSNATLVQNSKTNTRAVAIQNGQLYFSTQSTAGTFTAIGIYAIGSATPLTTSQQVTPVIVMPTGSQPEQFVFSANGLTCYVADSRSGIGSGGVQKWINSAGSWSLAYTIPTGTSNAGAFGLTAVFSGSATMIYATSVETNNNRLLAIQDVGASATATLLAQAGSGISWRGLALAPCNTPSVTSIGASGTVCAGEPVVLNATASGDPVNVYQWQGNGVFVGQSSNSPTITNATSGDYTVTATNACGSASAVISVSVKPLPLVQASASATGVCIGSTVVLSGTGATSYNWTGGVNNGQPFVPTSNSIYTVTGLLNGCIAQTTVAVIVYTTSVQAPSVALCAGQQATLVAAGASQYYWTPGGTGSVQITSPSVTTVYTVTGLSQHGCVATTTTLVKVTQLPQLSVNSGTACAGDNFTVVASGAGVYAWSNGVSTSTMVITQPTAATVQLTVTGALPGCPGSSSATTTVQFLPLPQLTITGNTLSCDQAPCTLQAAGASSYTWTLGVNTHTLAFIPTTTMNIGVAGTLNGCTATTSIAVMVDKTPQPVVSVYPLPFCAGESVTLSAKGAHHYRWWNQQPDSFIVIKTDTVMQITVYGYSRYGCIKQTDTTINASLCTGETELFSTRVRLQDRMLFTSTATKKLQLIAATGELLWQMDNCGETTTVLPKLPNGLYILRVYTVNGAVARRLICFNDLISISAN